MVDDFVSKNKHRAVAFTNLGQVRYLSAMRHVDGVVGNSSSGILEAPSFKIGTVNIGDRQAGRVKADSVIDCLPETGAIVKAIQYLYSSEFQKKICEVSNPYGEGGAAKNIKNIIKAVDLSKIVKKSFFDIDFEI